MGACADSAEIELTLSRERRLTSLVQRRFSMFFLAMVGRLEVNLNLFRI